MSSYTRAPHIIVPMPLSSGKAGQACSLRDMSVQPSCWYCSGGAATVRRAARESPGEAWLLAEALGEALLAGGGKVLYTAYSAPLKLYER
jgi:hypothetical protein